MLGVRGSYEFAFAWLLCPIDPLDQRTRTKNNYIHGVKIRASCTILSCTKYAVRTWVEVSISETPYERTNVQHSDMIVDHALL